MNFMEKLFEQTLIKLWDEKLTLYRRPDSVYWWACFYHKRKQIRTSTKLADLEPAKNFASAWFFQRQAEIANGVVPAPKTRHFAAAADKALAAYEQLAGKPNGRSAAYVRNLRFVMEKLKPLVGAVPTANITQQTWNGVLEKLREKQFASATVHQYRNALQIVLKEAYRRGEIKTVPKLLADSTGKKADTPRTYFDEKQYMLLGEQLRQNICWHRDNNTRWIEVAEELRDYVQFVAGSGLRTGEARNIRFKDVEVVSQYDPVCKEQRNCLIIRNIKGKRSTSGVCRTYFTAHRAFMRCVARQRLGEGWKDSDALVFKHYHKDGFNKVLDDAKLRYTNDNPPKKRDLASLRHTYICFCLERGVAVADIAQNCRTSMQMIDKHYAKWRDAANNHKLNHNFAMNIDKE